jgi:tRNA(adenine34) deaminase
MDAALAQAKRALEIGEVPIGAVVAVGGRIVGEGFNQSIRSADPTAHAEVVALRAAAKALSNYRLVGATLYVTVEPCLMCVGALLHARVGEVVYGASEPKGGALRSILRIEDVPANHRFRIVAGIREAECREILVGFFKDRREKG